MPLWRPYLSREASSYLELHVNDAQERNARCPAQPNYVGLFSPTSADLHVYVIVLFGLVFLLLVMTPVVFISLQIVAQLGAAVDKSCRFLSERTAKRLGCWINRI